MKSNGIPASPQGRAASKVSVAQDLVVCFWWALQIFHQYAIICLGVVAWSGGMIFSPGTGFAAPTCN